MDFGSAWKYEIRDPNFGLCHITLKLITWPTDHNTLSDVKGVNHGDKPSDNSASATPQLSSPFCSVEYFNELQRFVLEFTTSTVLVQCQEPVLPTGLLSPASIFVEFSVTISLTLAQEEKRFHSYRALTDSSLVIYGERLIRDFRQPVWSHFRSF